jgi:hypothetical protein
MPRLTLAVGPYERVGALLSGEVRLEGIELAPTTLLPLTEPVGRGP